MFFFFFLTMFDLWVMCSCFFSWVMERADRAGTLQAGGTPFFFGGSPRSRLPFSLSTNNLALGSSHVGIELPIPRPLTGLFLQMLFLPSYPSSVAQFLFPVHALKASCWLGPSYILSDGEHVFRARILGGVPVQSLPFPGNRLGGASLRSNWPFSPWAHDCSFPVKTLPLALP